MSSLATLVKTGAVAKSLTATASAAITAGKPVILESNGTVTQVVRTTAEIPFSAGTPVEWNGDPGVGGVAVAYDSSNNKVVVSYSDYYATPTFAGLCIVATVSGTTTSWGTAVVFSSGAIGHMTSIAFDSTNNKMVIAYRDEADSNKGKAIVGTVSGTSISYGTAVEFESGATTDINCAFGNGQVLICYNDDGDTDTMKVIVGTVSGTAISFGTQVSSGWTYSYNPTVCYDSTADKFFVAFRDNLASNYGSSVVITVTGTTPAFGSAVTFISASIHTGGEPRLGVTYDPVADKSVLAYYNVPLNKGYAVVVTITGTTPSYGTAVIFNNNGDTESITSGYDPDTEKHVIIYNDQDVTNDPGTAIEGTVSGTSISFETAIIYQPGPGAAPNPNGMAYDTSNNKFVAVYAVNTGKGNATVITTGVAEVTNLTAAKFLGIAEEAIASSGSGSIIVQGGTATNLTGLTIGSNYYAQGDGTFATTAGTPSVKIGKAISTTSLILTGDS
jgi:hypothetical protein